MPHRTETLPPDWRWKVGDVIPLWYVSPRQLELTVRGIFRSSSPGIMGEGGLSCALAVCQRRLRTAAPDRADKWAGNVATTVPGVIPAAWSPPSMPPSPTPSRKPEREREQAYIAGWVARSGRDCLDALDWLSGVMNGIAALVLECAGDGGARAKRGNTGDEDPGLPAPVFGGARPGESLLVALGGALAGLGLLYPAAALRRSWSPVENGRRARDHFRNDLAVFGCDGVSWSAGRPLAQQCPQPHDDVGRVASQGIIPRGRPVLWSAQPAESLDASRHDVAHAAGPWARRVRVRGHSDAGAWPGADDGQDRGSCQRDCDESGALSEIESSLSRDQTGVLAAQPEIVTLANHQAAAVREIALQLTLRKQEGGSLASLSLRGSSPDAVAGASPGTYRSRTPMAAGHDGGHCRHPGGQAVS